MPPYSVKKVAMNDRAISAQQLMIAQLAMSAQRKSSPWGLEKISRYAKMPLDSQYHTMRSDCQLVNPFLRLRVKTK